jgi:MATE family multidrug resistance protein
MLSYSTMTLADTFFVASEGASALAGVGLGGTAAFVIFGFSFGLLRGVKILGAQARGAGAFDRERAALTAGMVTSLVLAAVSIVVGIGAAFAMPLLAGGPEAGLHARDYLLIRALSSPFVLLYVALREARYGRGDSRSPMVASVLANALNIVLDAVFVWGFDGGVRGVAIATFIASAVQAFLLLASVWKSEKHFVRPALADITALIRVGVATGVQFLLEIGSFSLLTILLARMPELELAAHQIAIQVIHFTFLPAIGVSETVSALVGQAIGARRLRLVGVVTNGGFALVIGYAAFCTVMLLLFGGVVARGFTDDGALIARASELLLIASLFQVFDAAGVIVRGT